MKNDGSHQPFNFAWECQKGVQVHLYAFLQLMLDHDNRPIYMPHCTLEDKTPLPTFENDSQQLGGLSSSPTVVCEPLYILCQ